VSFRRYAVGLCCALVASSSFAGGAAVNTPLPDGSTPLAWAVEQQDAARVRSLLRQGASPNASTPSLPSALAIACQWGDSAILDLLLDAKAKVNVTPAGGIAPLALCAGVADSRILRRLLAAGAVVEHADENGQTALMWAAARGRIDNLQVLLQHGAQINRATLKGLTPLMFALKSGNAQTPLALLQAGADGTAVAADGTTMVQLAMYQRDYAFAARLIDAGVDLTAYDREGYSLLQAAVLAGQPALVQQLIARGADVNATTGTPRVQRRYEVNFTSAPYKVIAMTPLLLAAQAGASGIMQQLVDAGARSDWRATDQTNIVLAAAGSGRLAALQLALQWQPDANVINANGQTPLHVLVSADAGDDTAAMLQLLAERGVQPKIKTKDGYTAADLVKEGPAAMQALFSRAYACAWAQTPGSGAGCPP